MSATKQQTVFEHLRERVPDACLKQRQQGGSNITYLSWYDACDLLDERAPGWSCEIKEVGELAGKIFVRVALTIEGVTRENIGCEDEGMKGYGDVFSNSVGMALKRAAALFGLARHLYDKSDSSRAPQRPQQRQSPPPPTRPAPVADPVTESQKAIISNLWIQLDKDGRLVGQAAWQEDLITKTGQKSRDGLTEPQAAAYIKSLQSLARGDKR